VANTIQRQDSLGSTNVDKELPLKFKPFRKVPASTKHYALTVESRSDSPKLSKIDIIKLNTKRAREEFVKNKFSRPSQIIAPIDTVDYGKELTFADRSHL